MNRNISILALWEGEEYILMHMNDCFANKKASLQQGKVKRTTVQYTTPFLKVSARWKMRTETRFPPTPTI